jgi:predicted nucleic acid-binding protein
MRKLLHWLTRDDVARTNAAQASVRLQHRRRDRDDIDAFLAQHATNHERRRRRGVRTGAHLSPTVASRRT